MIQPSTDSDSARLSRAHAHSWLAITAIVGAIFLIVGCDAIARANFMGISLTAAVDAVFRDPATGFLGFALLALPILGAELLAVELAHAAGMSKAQIMLLVIIAALGLLYRSGYLDYQAALAAKKWTAASLSLGLIPVKGAAILVIPLVLVIGAKKRARR